MDYISTLLLRVQSGKHITTGSLVQLGKSELGQGGDSGTVVEKSFSNQKVSSLIPCRSVLEQDTEPPIAPDVQCAISVNVKCVYILSRFG